MAARGFIAAVREFFTGEHRSEGLTKGVVPDVTPRGGARFLAGATAKSFGKTVASGTVDLAPTLQRIQAGERGTVFRNLEGLLPAKPAGYYERFVVPTEGVRGAGPQRLISGQGGELYYTPDHYQTFTRINP